jgi:hypothetical protein
MIVHNRTGVNVRNVRVLFYGPFLKKLYESTTCAIVLKVPPKKGIDALPALFTGKTKL